MINPSDLCLVTTLSFFKKPLHRSSPDVPKKDDVPALLEAAKLHLANGRFDLAADQYQLLTDLRPNNVGLLVSLAYALRSDEQLDAARTALKSAITIEPSRADLYYMLGEIELQLDQPGEAVRLFRMAIERQSDFLFGHYDLVKTLMQLKQFDEANKAADAALEALPDAPALLCIRGNLYLFDQQQLDALQVYQRAVELAPQYYFSQMGVGTSLQLLGRPDESQAYFARAIEADPSSANARWAYAMGHIMPSEAAAGYHAESVDTFRRALVEFEEWAQARTFDEPALIAEAQPFLLGYRDGNHRQALALYGGACVRLMSRWYDRHSFVRPPTPPTESRKLRLGIASSFFREHSVWFANLKGFIKTVDQKCFEIHAFHVSDSYDAETLWAQEHATTFERGARSLASWVQTILDRQLDVMIYPSPAIDLVPFQLACLPLVHRQITTWGHPETTGLPTIGHYVSAELFEPPSAQEHYVERLIVLSGIGAHYTPYVTADDASDCPDIDYDKPLVLCAGTPFKYQARYDDLIVEIAKRAGDCQILFFRGKSVSQGALLEERMRQAFLRGGLDPEKFLRFVAWMKPAAFHALMARSTVMLDTIDFSGFNTAIQAIEAGLPIITREGTYLRGRLASGVLRGIGLPELIVSSEAAYVELAVRIILDGAYASSVRDRIRAGRDAVINTSAPIREFEKFLYTLTAA